MIKPLYALLGVGLVAVAVLDIFGIIDIPWPLRIAGGLVIGWSFVSAFQ